MKISEMTRNELRAVAKELNIKGRGHMTKAQLVEAVEKASTGADSVGTQTEDKDCEESNVVHKSKIEYVENAEVGTIVAFKVPNGKVKSAAIANRSAKRRVLKLVTKYGAEFVVPYEDVIWVRTTKRWPKGVYNLLKGVTSENEEIRNEERQS